VSAAIITPSAYWIPRTEVPVTMGRRVRSVAAERALVEAGWREDEPPEVRESDIVMRSRRREERMGCEDEMVTCVFYYRLFFIAGWAC